MGLFNLIRRNIILDEIELERNMDVNELCRIFQTAFGLSLRVSSEAEDDELVQKKTGEVTNPKGKLKIKAYEKVGDVEQKIANHFGLKVQIASKANTYLIDADLKLGEAAQL